MIAAFNFLQGVDVCVVRNQIVTDRQMCADRCPDPRHFGSASHKNDVRTGRDRWKHLALRHSPELGGELGQQINRLDDEGW